MSIYYPDIIELQNVPLTYSLCQIQSWFSEQLWKISDDKNQRWKLDKNKKLENKKGVWKSDCEWKFIEKNDGLFCIENTSKQKTVWTLGTLDKVTLETFVEGKGEQLWKKGEPDAEGYFTLENSGIPKVIAAISESRLNIEGNSTSHYLNCQK